MVIGIALTTALALGFIQLPIGHIQLSMVSFIYTIFAQAFVMFYFIGVSRLVQNVYAIINSGAGLNELFDNPPENLAPYKEKVIRFVHDTDRFKRQTIPWTMLMLVLGAIAFLLGGAHDTGLVERTTHSGVVYGFLVAMLIGFVRQWYYLGKGHLLLRKIKALFEIPDGSM
jgi:ABC-type multidrug transport system fused ATPase/permease subunit